MVHRRPTTWTTVARVVVSGAHDLDHFGEVAALLGEQIPGAETVELDWAGHLPALERPDAVIALLLDVLRDDVSVSAVDLLAVDRTPGTSPMKDRPG